MMGDNCENIELLLTAYVDNELSAEQRRKVTQHLAHCSDCREIVQDLENTNQILHLAFSGEQEPDVDLSGVWEEIESQLDFRASVWKRLKEGIGRPVVWIPTAFAATAAALLIFLLPMPKKQMPMTVSQIESVYSQTGQVMVMQTASSGQPLIWILPRPEKEVSG